MNQFYENYERNTTTLDSHLTQKERSFAQQMRPVYVCGQIGKFIIHVLSYCSCVIYPAFLFEYLFGNFSLGLVIGCVTVLLFIEIPKWTLVNTFFENYFYQNSRKISFGIAFFALVEISISIVSSVFGVPLLIDKLSPSATLISIEQIEQEFDQQAQRALSLYQPQIESLDDDIDNYFESNKKTDQNTGNFRLSTSERVRAPYNKMKASREQIRSLLNERLDVIETEKTNRINEARSDNRQRVESHDFTREHAGTIAMIVMLILELFYVVIICLSKYYLNRCRLEQIGPTEQDSDEHISTNQDSQSIRQEHSNTDEQGSNKSDTDKQTRTRVRHLGNNQDSDNDELIKNHGSPFFENGAHVARVWYEKKDGTFTSYTESDCLRMSKRKQASQDFRDEMIRLAQIAKNHKREKTA